MVGVAARLPEVAETGVAHRFVAIGVILVRVR